MMEEYIILHSFLHSIESEWVPITPKKPPEPKKQFIPASTPSKPSAVMPISTPVHPVQSTVFSQPIPTEV